MTYRAIITEHPVLLLGVLLEGDESGLALVRHALKNVDGQPSLYVQEVATASEAVFRVKLSENQFNLSRIGANKQLDKLVTAVKDITEAGAIDVVKRLEHMSRWHSTLHLENLQSKLSQAVQMDVFAVTDQSVSPVVIDSEPILDLVELSLMQPSSAQKPQYKIRVKNTGKVKLYCVMLYLDNEYAVFADLLEGSDSKLGVWLNPGEEVSAWSDNPIPCLIPDDWSENGITEIHDRIKLIASTEPFDAYLLQLEPLTIEMQPLRKRGNKERSPNNSLERLLDNLQSGMRQMQREKRLADWVTIDLPIHLIRPLDQQPLSESTSLVQNLTLHNHAQIMGDVRLTSIQLATRDIGIPTIPAFMNADEEHWQLWSFQTTQSGNPDLYVLELNNVQRAEAVTRETPLELQIQNAKLEKGEMIVATAWDSELGLYLPLGIGRQDDSGVSVNIERLPSPAAIGTKSLTGAIRILFHKLVGRRIGLEYPYPLLRAVTFDESAKPVYSQPDEVAALVANANRILLFVHGIIGDTESLLTCFESEDFQLENPYDLILTFDYESINDGIIKNAQDLKSCLEKVGLVQQQGKHLDIVAHSMGGLVSRCFIELFQGNMIVKSLIMLGTPNQGSPWAKAQDWVSWATATFAVGLNVLGTANWSFRIIAGILGFIEQLDKNMDDLNPNSGVFSALAATSDPKIPYTLICGDVLLETSKQPLFQKLAKKLGTRAFFANQPNDIAVSMESAMNVASNREPAPIKVVAIACDHMSYFSTPVGITALVNALNKNDVTELTPQLQKNHEQD
ncbi:MAG: hypothetical protein RLZZ156_733 [Deinococcota bacterium]